MTPPPSFGKRGLVAPPRLNAPGGLPGEPTSGPRRLRSGLVIVGVASLVALSAGAAVWQLRDQYCQPKDPVDPHSIPSWCRASHSSGHGFGGGSWGHSHASFGGFGAHGSSHGGGG